MPSLSSPIISALFRLTTYVNPFALRERLQFRELSSAYYRKLWRDSALGIGADCEDWGYGFFRISRRGLSTMVRDGSVMADNYLMLELFGNKAATYKLLRERGYPVPESEL